MAQVIEQQFALGRILYALTLLGGIDKHAQLPGVAVAVHRVGGLGHIVQRVGL